MPTRIMSVRSLASFALKSFIKVFFYRVGSACWLKLLPQRNVNILGDICNGFLRFFVCKSVPYLCPDRIA